MRVRWKVAGILGLALVSACQQAPAELKADHAWVRLPAVSGNPGAAYFQIHGGSEPATLVAVAAPFAVRTELHESMKTDAGAMTMAPIRDVAVPVRDTLAFAPGGKHVMLFDVSPDVKAGQQVPLTLSFADGKTLEVKAKVMGPADPPPAD